jgi:serine/threonine protein kinase
MSSVGCYSIGETIGEVKNQKDLKEILIFIKFSNFTQGSYGKVKKGVHKLTGKVVAVKKISKEHAPIMVREIHHHKQLKHPNIITLYEMVSTETSIHIISEYASNGDMLDALAESGGRCAEDRVLKWFHQITNAIDFCHTRGIVHR